MRLVESSGDIIGTESGKSPLYPTRKVLLNVSGEFNSKVSDPDDANPLVVCTGLLNTNALLVWSYEITGMCHVVANDNYTIRWASS